MLSTNFILWALAALLAGCASLPNRGAHVASESIQEVGGTSLAAVVARSLPNGADGFKLLPEPRAALEARVALINQAERSIDVQYFIWHPDTSGRLLLIALKDAALRGVRVRILLDDLNTTQVDAILNGLTGFPGVEVRLFNPFPAGRSSLVGRIATSLGDLRRIRHRMHNKLLVADNLAAITGGRNIGDTYLGAGEGTFLDVDILTFGPIVREMSEGFDDYWNSDYAFSGNSIWGETSAEARRESFQRLATQPAEVEGSQQVGTVLPLQGLGTELTRGMVSLQVCAARFFVDPVEKVSGVSLDDSSATVHQRLIDLFASAQQELYVVSPYFVRGRIGLRRIKALSDRGVRLRLLTNSGSTTDEPLAHAVYLRYRKPLLELGVKIREFVAPEGDEDEINTPRLSASRLHAKVAIVDRRHVYIGSLNFTSRSERINTESGLILDCPALANELVALIDSAPAYDLRLAHNRLGIQWVDRRWAPERVWDVEPEISIWQHLKTIVIGSFVPEEEV